MLDAVGIIHMNGRIYDPRLGRFMQADPVIQFPDYSQSWNRYSYVLNNPLAYTDPTGYFPFITALAVVGLIAADITSKIIIAAVIGTAVFADSLAQGVPLDKAFLAGVSAAALTAVALGTFPKPVHGGFGWNAATYGHLASVATVGGITASLQGGKFGHGFLSAGIGAGVGGIPALRGVSAGRVAARTVVSAVTAGTVSEITGGKFANGAMTAAFFSLVSSAAQRANMPNFDEMSDQELTNWILENKDLLDFDLPGDVTVQVMDEGIMVDNKTFVRVSCGGPCPEPKPGEPLTVIEGNYNRRTNTIELYKNAFTPLQNYAPPTQLPNDSTHTYFSLFREVSRAGHAVFVLGHEAAHVRGIDLLPGVNETHYQANYYGRQALRNFRRHFGD